MNHELTLSSEDVPFSLSPAYQIGSMPSALYSAVLLHLRNSNHHVRSGIDIDGDMTRSALRTAVQFYDYIVLNGRRYAAASRSHSPRNSLIEALDADNHLGVYLLNSIIYIEQEGVIQGVLLAAFRHVRAELTRPIWSGL